MNGQNLKPVQSKSEAREHEKSGDIFCKACTLTVEEQSRNGRRTGDEPVKGGKFPSDLIDISERDFDFLDEALAELPDFKLDFDFDY